MKVLLFSGTTEGRDCWEYLYSNGINVDIFVATDYGNIVMPEEAKKYIYTGRLDEESMFTLFCNEKNSNDKLCIIDATHPYASLVSSNIENGCKRVGIDYYRLIRSSSLYKDCEVFENFEDVTNFLSKRNGNILLTTGSKDLQIFTKVREYKTRVYPRVLPSIDSLSYCLELGYLSQNIICMQGPFSKGLNYEILKQVQADYLVTKDTGKTGGFDEKIEAAKKYGAKVLIVKRPLEKKGYLFQELKRELQIKYNIGKVSDIKYDTYNKYPIFLDMRKIKILIVGGGKIASRRVETLLKFQANITVIAKEASDYILEASNKSKIKLIINSIKEADITKDYFMIVAATSNQEINNKVVEWSKNLEILCNNASNKKLSDFYFPAIFSNETIIGGIISKSGEEHKELSSFASEIRLFLKDRKEVKMDGFLNE